MSGYATPPARCTRRFAQRCPLRDASDVGCVCWAQPCVHCHDGSFVYGRTCTEINRSYELLTKVPTDAPSPRPFSAALTDGGVADRSSGSCASR